MEASCEKEVQFIAGEYKTLQNQDADWNSEDNQPRKQEVMTFLWKHHRKVHNAQQENQLDTDLDCSIDHTYIRDNVDDSTNHQNRQEHFNPYEKVKLRITEKEPHHQLT